MKNETIWQLAREPFRTKEGTLTLAVFDANPREDESPRVSDVYGISEAEMMERARLIEAAPALLTALRDLQRELRNVVKMDVRKRGHYSLMVAEAVATKAVLKAEGRL